MKEFWDNISTKEELDKDDEYINRQLRWREIKRNLNGVKTILDIGAATGSFSIPLAKMGYDVTHFDLSDKMIDVAKEKAKGINNIAFIQGNAKDLSIFNDRQFDFVLNLDGAISFSGTDAEKVISESSRVTRNKMLISASNKGCMVATWLNFSLNQYKELTPAVYEMMNHGYWNVNQYAENKEIAEKFFPVDSFKAYTPNELKKELEKNNMKVLFSRSLGSLSHLYLLHLYRQFPNEKQSNNMNTSEDFINACEKFDIEIMPNGPGSFRRAGVIALAERNT